MKLVLYNEYNRNDNDQPRVYNTDCWKLELSFGMTDNNNNLCINRRLDDMKIG